MACFVPEVHAEKSKTEAWLNEVCTSIPDIFHRRKKRRELCRTETHQISFASMILIHGFSGLSESFIIIIIFINLSYVCLEKDLFHTHVSRKRSYEGSFDSPLPLQMCPPWSGSKSCLSLNNNPRGLCYCHV